MVVALRNQLISLKTSIGSKSDECLLDSGVSHNFLALDWYYKNVLKVENGEIFRIWLADRLEVCAIGKACCFVDLGPMKTAITFYVLDCNVPCVLGIPFPQTVNPTIDWVNCSVKISTVLGESPLEVVQQGATPQSDIVSTKQFEKG